MTISKLIGSAIILTAISINCAHAESAVRNINASGGISRAVVVEDVALAHTTQILPLDRKGALVGKGDAEKQIGQVLENLSHALGKGGSSLEHAVKINVYAANNEAVAAVQKAFAKKFTKGGPAVCFVVGQLANSDAVIAMDAVGAVSGSSPKDVVRSQAMMLAGKKSEAHVAVLPAGGAVYVSGQAKDGADLAEATRKTLESLGATLEWMKLKKSDVVELKAFTRPMSDAGIVQEEFRKYFGSELTPPSSLVEWTSAKPQIEIELVAATHKEPRTPGGRNIATPDATHAPSDSSAPVDYLTPPGFTPSNVYAKVARLNRGKTIYFSSLCSKEPGNGEAQVLGIFGQLGELLKESGSDFEHLVKATYYVSDNDAGDKLNKLRPKFYDPKRPHAASKALVKGVGLAERTITVDMIGTTKE